jgi:hypothetical protein
MDTDDVSLRERSELSWPVDVGAVLDGYDSDQSLLVINAVDHAIIPAACAMKSLHAELQGLADAVWAGRERAIEEFHDSGRHFLWELGQCRACRSGPRDREIIPAHWPEMRRRASSLVSTGGSAAPNPDTGPRVTGGVHCPDRSVPAPVTDSGDDRPILGHGNGFATLPAHDGAGGSRKGAATTVVTVDRWREMLVASERVTPRYARQVR